MFGKIILILLSVLLVFCVVSWVTGATDPMSDLHGIVAGTKTVVDVINTPFTWLAGMFNSTAVNAVVEWFPLGWLSKGLGALGGIF